MYIEGNEDVTEENPRSEEKVGGDGNLPGGSSCVCVCGSLFMMDLHIGWQSEANMFALFNHHAQRRYILAIDAAPASATL